MATMTLGTPWHGKRPFPRPLLHPFLRRVFETARRTVEARLNLGHGNRTEPTDTQIRREKALTAVASYAAFLAAHPEMPQSHSNRFLGEIVRNCEEVRALARDTSLSA